MTKQFDDRLLDRFAQSFYGYGNYSGAFWFIGMEEGGGNSLEEIARRLDAWANRGEREIDDIVEFHAEIQITHLFNDRPELQPTWNKLIRILLSSDGKEPTTDQVREFQRTSLGRRDGNNCLVELLPLPSPATDRWLYGEYSALGYLVDRDSYKQACLTHRVPHLQMRINEHKPKVVVFYGLGYRQHWQEIAGVDFEAGSDGIDIGRNGSSLFVITKHPATQGVTNEYFHQVGQTIALYIESLEAHGDQVPQG